MMAEQLEALIMQIVAQQKEIWRLEEMDLNPLLASGASLEMIEQVEKVMQIKFSPSYAFFLTLHDGCRYFSSSFDLLGTKDMLKPEYQIRVETFHRSGWEHNDNIAAEGLVIGYAEDTNTFVILDRTIEPDDRGEMPVVVWEFGEVSRSKDFYRFLEFRSEVNEITIKNLKILLAGGSID